MGKVDVKQKVTGVMAIWKDQVQDTVGMQGPAHQWQQEWPLKREEFKLRLE